MDFLKNEEIKSIHAIKGYFKKSWLKSHSLHISVS